MSAVAQLFCQNIALLGKSWPKLVNQDSLNSIGLILGEIWLKRAKKYSEGSNKQPSDCKLIAKPIELHGYFKQIWRKIEFRRFE